MKKLFLVALLAIGVSAVSFAQGFQRPTPEAQVENLKTAGVTGITAEQSAKLIAIYTAAAKTQDSIRTAANGDFASMGPAMQTARTAQSAKIKAVLTADQQKQFDAIPPRGRGQGGPGGGGAPRN